MTSNSSSEDRNNNNTTELLNQIIHELCELNITTRALLEESRTVEVPSALTSPIQGSVISTISEGEVEVGDEVIIVHRYRGQYGVIGTVHHTTEYFVTLRTTLGREYKKHRKHVRKYHSASSNRRL